MSAKKLVIALIILGLAFGGWQLLKRRGQNGAVQNYRVQRVEKGQLRVAVGATGTINPVMVVNVGTQISGTIKEIYVDFNDRVTEGQLLMILDDQLFRAKVDMSEANLANAQAQYRLAELKFERQDRLYQAKTSTREEYDTARANLEMAKATVAQHEASLKQDMYNLNNTRVTSPVNGVVINRGVDVGQTVAASFQTPTLFNIAGDLTKMQINASFAEADIGRLTPGLGAVFSVDAHPGDSFTGTLRQIRLNPTITSNVVTYDVVIDVDNPDRKLLPGMTAYVDIELYREDDVLLVPNTALNFRPTGLALPPDTRGTSVAAASAAEPPAAGGSPAEPPAEDGSPSKPPLEGAPAEGSPPAEPTAEGGPPANEPTAEGGPPANEPTAEAGLAEGGPPEGGSPAKPSVESALPANNPAQATESHGRVFRLGPNGQPESLELVLGATDLRFTVVKSGPLRPGDQVLVGENLPEADRTLMSGSGMGGPMGGRRR